MLLLDTNALLWLSAGSDNLGPQARTAIAEAVLAEKIAFSAISVWETAVLVRKGRYAIGLPLERWRADLLDAGLKAAPIDGVVAARAGSWTDLHEDPADRFIAATALRLGARLVTSDRKLLAWADLSGTPGMDARL